MTTIALRARRGLPPAAVAATAVVGVVATGTLVALGAAAGDDAYLVPALVRARAPWLSGPLARASIAAPLDAVLLAVAAMAASYCAAVVLAPRLRLRWVLAAVALLDVVFVLAPPLLSNDVFNYVDVARLAGRYGLDPYRTPPAAGPHAGLYVFVHWRHAVTVYGPVFTELARLLGRARVSQAVLGFKVAAGAAAFASTLLVAWIAARRGAAPARAAAAFGLNPLVLVWTVGGGHNDALMVLALLAGVALLTAGRPASATAAVVAGAAVKLSAGLALPFLIAGSGHGRRVRALAGAVAAAAVVIAFAYVAFPDHAVGELAGLRHQQGLDSLSSLPTEAADALGLAAVTPLEATVFHVLLGGWLAACAVGLARGADPVVTAGWALLGVVMASTWLLPWYPVWPLALAACTGDRRLLIATCALGASYVIGHVPLS